MNLHAQFVAVDPEFATSNFYTPSEKSVGLALRSHLPRVFPSVWKLQQETGLCRNTIFKCLKSLEAKGYLKRIKRLGTSNLYYFNPKTLLPKVYRKMRKMIDKELTAWRTYLDRKKAKPEIPKSGTGVVPNTGTQTRSSETILEKDENFGEELPKNDFTHMVNRLKQNWKE